MCSKQMEGSILSFSNSLYYLRWTFNYFYPTGNLIALGAFIKYLLEQWLVCVNEQNQSKRFVFPGTQTKVPG